MKRNYFGAILTLFALGMIIFGAASAANAQLQFRRAMDFDGDGKADITTRRFGNGVTTWFTYNSSNGSLSARQWGGIGGDKRYLTGDYDGDGRADYAVTQANGNQLQWYIRRSQTNTLYAVNFGGATAPNYDYVAPADYDGDGKTDIGVIRYTYAAAGDSVPSAFSWYYISSLNGQVGGRTVNVTVANRTYCIPTNGDFDGDGKADFAHICDNTQGTITWDVVRSSDGGRRQTQWGSSGDQMASGDYDGDGKTDVGVARPVPIPGSATDKQLVWYILLSSNQSVMVKQFGGYFANFTQLISDLVAPADYDGDGKTDVAVYRPRTLNDIVSSYYILQSSNNQVRGLNWGFENDSSANFGLYNAAGQNAQY